MLPFGPEASAPEAARALVGCTLLLHGVGGRIVETEAYDEADAASHTFGGRSTARNATMFGAPGHAYVYRSYGLHWCFNIVCGPVGHGAGVLIRALEPTHGIDVMQARRGGAVSLALLCAGPGRLCQALGIDRGHDGLAVDAPPFELLGPQLSPVRPATDNAEIDAGNLDALAIATGPRIGITRAADVPWRFGIAGSRFLSRPFAATPVAERVGTTGAASVKPSRTFRRSP